MKTRTSLFALATLSAFSKKTNVPSEKSAAFCTLSSAELNLVSGGAGYADGQPRTNAPSSFHKPGVGNPTLI